MTDNNNNLTHIAFIMDGNGRWAQSRALPRIQGHYQGVNAARDIVEACGKMNVKVATFFAFCTENWKRPKEEVEGLMDLFSHHLESESDSLNKNQVRVKVIGSREGVRPEIISKIEHIEKLTKNNNKFHINLAFNYSGKWDILQATKKVAQDVKENKLEPIQITEQVFESYLSLANLPKPDLLIRTSGEMRISNYLLWDLAYTELYFTEVLWPDFGADDLKAAIKKYNMRDRRFGGVKALIKEETLA